MKQLLVLGTWIPIICLLGGCQSAEPQPSEVKVATENDSVFPDFLVGTWKADYHGWEFVLAEDGTLSSAVMSLGRIRMFPGQVARMKTVTGGDSVFEPGEWTAAYAPATRELTVQIALKNLRIEMGDNVLEGKSTDIFVGPVSEDGNTWQVKWTSFPQYTAHTPEHPNFPMAADEQYGVTKTLIFEKVTQK
ncbi:MAG: hypothetical protein JSU70_11910 [Phycisphaerales bacterium]|nr:MAG: hypothetical protein JSU70_11910 [Phycisphaerales bacterium]